MFINAGAAAPRTAHKRALFLSVAALAAAPALAHAAPSTIFIHGANNVGSTFGGPPLSLSQEDVVAISTGAAVNLTFTGAASMTSTGSISVVLGAPGASTLVLQSGGSITGVTGIDASAHTDLGQYNSGGVTGGLALTTAGTIDGTGGTAIQFGTGNDTLTLQTGSVITGAVDGGTGSNTLDLSGTSNTQTVTQTVGAYTNFQIMNVNAGYWTLGVGATYPTVSIASGAALEVDDLGATSNGGLGFTSLTDSGELVLDTATALTEAGNISGTGNVVVSGAGNVTLSGTSSVGVTTVQSGDLIVTGPLTSGFSVGSGATLQGNTATLLAQGNVTDNGTVVFDQANTGAFANTITGSGVIVKQNAGTLTLSGTSSVASTSVTGGTLIVTGPLTSGFSVGSGATLQGNTASLLAQGNVTDNGTLVFDQANTGAFANTITGSGVVVKQNAGTLTLSGTSSVASTSVTGGGLIVTGPLTSAFSVGSGATLQGNTASLLAQGNVTDNGALVFDQAATGAFGNTISGTGVIVKQNTGALTLSGTSNVASTSVTGGTLIVTGPLTSGFSVGNGATLQGSTATLLAQGNVTDNGNVVFDQATTGAFANTITGTGAITKQNAGTLTLSGASSVASNSVTGGTLIVTGPLTSALSVGSGATLQGSSATLLAQGGVTDNGTLVFDQAGGGSFANAITGSGAIVKQNTGVLTLSGTSTVASTSVTGGTLIVTGPLTSGFSVGSGATLQGNTASLLAQGNVTDNGTLVFDQANTGAFANAITGSGAIMKQNSGALTLSGTSSVASTSVTGGSLIVTGSLTSAFNIGANGTLQGNTSTLLAQGGVTDNGVLVFDQGANATFANNITGSGAIVKQNTGQLMLSGTSSVASTSVTGGQLVVNGPLTSSFSVGSSGSLVGSSTSLLAQGAIADNGILDFNQTAAGTFANNITGNGELMKQGAAALTLSGAVTQQSTVVNGGTLIVTGSDASAFLVTSGSTLQGSSASLLGSVTNNGALVFDQSASGTFASAIAGTGTITKQNTGVLTLSGSAAASSTTVNGGSLIVTGTLSSPVTVAAGGSLQIGAGAAAGSVQGAIADNGTVAFDRTDNVTFSGAFSGNGALIDNDPSVLTFSGPYSFTGATTINGGGALDIAQLAANTNIDLNSGTLNLTGTSSSIGVLSGAGGTVNIATGDTLTVSSGDFGGNISGGGALTKASSGLLILGGTANIGGPTDVAAGTLEVDGSLTSPTVEVNGGAALGGDGTIHGAVTVDSGGVFSPGDPVTTTVAGSVTFKTGSTYVAQVTGAGAHDLIQVTGPVTIQSGAAVQAQPLGAISTYARLNAYQIVTATGGVSGVFSSVTSSMPLLTPELSYSANAVTLTLARNDVAFATLAATPNQASVGAAVQAGGVMSPLFLALVAQSTPGAQAGFNALSGEIYADLPTLTFSQADQTRRTLMDRLDQTGHSGLWAEGTGDWTRAGGQAGVAGASANSGGGTLGLDGDMGGWRLGVAGGYTQQNIDVGALDSSARDNSETLSVYAGTDQGPLTARIGGSYAWRQFATARTESFPSFTDQTAAAFDASSAQMFGEVGYQVKTANGAYGPFVGASYDELSTPAFRESGGPSALAVTDGGESAIALRVGLKASARLGSTEGGLFSLHGSADWRYEAGELATTDLMRFEGTGQAFDVTGLALARNAADISAGVTGRFGPHLKVDVSYAGTLAQHWQDNSVKLLVAWTF